MVLNCTSRACEGHPMHIKTLTKTHPFPIGAPLLIPPSLHILLRLFHLNTIPNRPTNHFSHILLHSLSGMHHPRGGGAHTIMFQIYFLHHLLDHNFYTVLHITNLRCLPSQIRTRTICRLNKYTMERHHTQLML